MYGLPMRMVLPSLLMAGAAALEWRDGALIATVQVAGFSSGRLSVPEDTEYVLMEIGCSDFDTIAIDVAPKHPKAFTLSFEPMLDKYATLLAQGTKTYHGDIVDRSVPLGHVSPRGVILPLAVSTSGGALDFTVAPTAGCSSLMKLNEHAGWGGNCHGTMETRQVESVTLQQAYHCRCSPSISRCAG